MALRKKTGHAKRLGHGPLDGACAFVSDVHLFDPDDENTHRFLGFLRCVGVGDEHSGDDQAVALAHVRTLFLVGDIFEFIDASVTYFRDLWKDVFAELAQATKRGVRVFFIEGNHDFGFEHGVGSSSSALVSSSLDQKSWKAMWSAYAGDAGLDFEHETAGPLHVRHGDDVVSEPGYRVFRAFVKSSFAARILRCLPAAPAHRFFIGFASVSRRAGSGYSLTLAKIRRDFSAFLALHPEAPPGTVVIGHIHVYLDAVVDGTRVIAGPDWYTAPSYLLLRADGVFERVFLDPDRRLEPLVDPNGPS